MVEHLETPKEEFLASVRQALGRSAASPPVPPYSRLEESLADLEALERDLLARLETGRDVRLEALAETAARRGWKVRRAPDTEEALGYLSSVMTQLGVRRAVRSTEDVFQQLAVDSILQRPGIETTIIAQNENRSRETLRQEMIDADIGITGADYAVAETGSVVVLPRAGLSRLVSLAPPVHLALVRPQDVVDTLDDVFLLRRLDYYRNGRDMGSYLNFITGPSRTADIEQTLVVGVHGPKEVHMIILG
ncbi:MAG: lactate utilization protein C [Stenotrophomonas maltophilia]